MLAEDELRDAVLLVFANKQVSYTFNSSVSSHVLFLLVACCVHRVGF